MRVLIAILLSISLLFNGLNILCLSNGITFDELKCLFVLKPSFFLEKEPQVLWSEECNPLHEERPRERNEENSCRVRAGPVMEA